MRALSIVAACLLDCQPAASYGSDTGHAGRRPAAGPRREAESAEAQPCGWAAEGPDPDSRIPPRFLNDRDGLYPKIGSLTTGSGLALGAGYRNRQIFARRGAFDSSAPAASAAIGRWRGGRRSLSSPTGGCCSRPSAASANIRASRSSVSDRIPIAPIARRFSCAPSDVEGRAGVRIWPKLIVGAEAGYMKPRTGSGNKSGHSGHQRAVHAG